MIALSFCYIDEPDIIKLERGHKMEVTFDDGSIGYFEDKPFSSGAQGKLYRSLDGNSVVKLYKSDPKREAKHREHIQLLISDFNPTKDHPYWNDYFAWPQKCVVAPRVGFSMRHIPMKKLDEHLPYYYSDIYGDLRPQERGWFIGRLAVAIKLVSAANRLASLGLCYSDFSDKNVMVDPVDGRMTLIDCDRLFVPDKFQPEYEGTSFYKAPEIFSGHVNAPSPQTDRHALAVLLYIWLVGWHPLDGDKVYPVDMSAMGDEDQQDTLRYGREALYIEHPTDHSNRCSKHKFTACALGSKLKELFEAAFIKGLHNPAHRPHPYQWQRALAEAYDRVIPCSSPSCEWRYFIVPNQMRHLTCPYCLQPVKYPRTLPVITLLEHNGTSDLEGYNKSFQTIIGWPGRKLREWHVKAHHSPIPTSPDYYPDRSAMASFEFDSRKGQWYLYNDQ